MVGTNERRRLAAGRHRKRRIDVIQFAKFYDGKWMKNHAVTQRPARPLPRAGPGGIGWPGFGLDRVVHRGQEKTFAS
jgi:hypothetical protein